MTGTKIRYELASAKRRGIDTAEILHSFGVEKSSALTPDQYPAVVEKIDEAWMRLSIQRILKKANKRELGIVYNFIKILDR